MTDTRPEALRRLDALVGRWEVTMDAAFDPSAPITGTATFEWQEGLFLVERSSTDHPDVPDGVLVIGVDDTTDDTTALYTDSRGVHRIYRMSLRGGEWRMWRDAPGFAQRFTGTFEGADTIKAVWEINRDGMTWVHDFALTYRRTG